MISPVYEPSRDFTVRVSPLVDVVGVGSCGLGVSVRVELVEQALKNRQTVIAAEIVLNRMSRLFVSVGI